MNYKPGDLFKGEAIERDSKKYYVVMQLGYSSPDGPEFCELHPHLIISEEGKILKELRGHATYIQIKKEEITDYQKVNYEL